MLVLDGCRFLLLIRRLVIRGGGVGTAREGEGEGERAITGALYNRDEMRTIFG